VGSGAEAMKPLNQWTFVEVIAFIKSVDKKTWVIALSSFVGFVFLVVFLVIPAWIERPLLRRDIESMEAQIRQVNALAQKRPGWEESQRVFGALIERTGKRVFSDEDLGLLLGQVSKMADESRVDVLASKPLNEKMVFAAPFHLKYQPSGYEFSVQGGYHDLGNLASRIETHEKLLRIRSLAILTAEKTPDRQIAELQLWAIMKAPPQVKEAKPKKNAKK
jgi:Tfp pilus assembly protein PilO